MTGSATKIGKDAWLKAAIDYIPLWLEYQLQRHQQVGAAVAIRKGSKLVAEWGLGSADLRAGIAMTPRHRFRVASHSKSFTAAGIMMLREQGKLSLDDPVGRFVPGLHKSLAKARISEVLSHGAGITRDGDDSGHFRDARPFPDREELLRTLSRKQPLEPGVQLKYSNFGYGLLGLVIESVSGTDYPQWMRQNIIDPLGLHETEPDMPLPDARTPMATGHSAVWPFEKRLSIAGTQPCRAFAPAAGFVSTASDLTRFYAQLSPLSKKSVLSVASRREMAHGRWRDALAAGDEQYAFGLITAAPESTASFGHTGGFQGFVSRTAHFTDSGITVSVLCNGNDGMSYAWVEGLVSIIGHFRKHGAPARKIRDWEGRWWSLWGAYDFVAAGDRLYHCGPGLPRPFDGFNSVIEITGKDKAVIEKTSSYNSPGEGIRRVRDKHGKVIEMWFGGLQLKPKEGMMAEMKSRYPD